MSSLFSTGSRVMQPVLLPSTPLFLARKAAVVYPVRVDDPFERRSVADVAVVRGDAIEHHNDHIWINGSVVPVHNRLIGIHDLGMSCLKRTQWHHVQIRLEALKFDGFCLGSIVSSMSRVVGGDLTRFEIQDIESFLCRGL